MSTHTTPKVTEVSFCDNRKKKAPPFTIPRGTGHWQLFQLTLQFLHGSPGNTAERGRVCKKQQWTLANVYVAWLARDNAKCFMRIVGSSWSSIHLIKDILLFPPLYRWGNRGIERLSNRPRISQILKCTLYYWTQTTMPHFYGLQRKSRMKSQVEATGEN